MALQRSCGIGRHLAETTDGGQLHGLSHIGQSILIESATLRVLEELGNLLRTETTRDTFAARFIAEKLHAIARLLDQVCTLAKGDEGTAKHGTECPQVLRIERQIVDIEVGRASRQAL